MTRTASTLTDADIGSTLAARGGALVGTLRSVLPDCAGGVGVAIHTGDGEQHAWLPLDAPVTVTV